MKRALTVSLALLSTSALAFTHIDQGGTYMVWSPEDMPIEYWVADGDVCPVEAGYCTEAAQLGWAAWHDASCADFTEQYMGEGDNRPQIPGDGQFHISFGDVNNEIDEPGTLATTRCQPGSERAFVQDGKNYNYMLGCDIMFNDDVEFVTPEDTAAEVCGGRFNIREVMTHEIGHSLGLGHSCEDDEICSDPKLLEAVMFWAAEECSTEKHEITEDDIEGLTALYGPFATFSCSHELDPDDSDTTAAGNVPFTLRCAVESDAIDEITSAVWSWGDGGMSEGLRIEHEYTEPGNYNLQLEVNGDREECGEDGWDYSFRKVGYVRACGIPDAQFEVERVEGLKYRLFNDTDLSVHGCVFNVEWQVFRGEGTEGELLITQSNWEPLIELPEGGTYTVVQNVGGPAGTGASTVTFQTTGGGCNVAPAGMLGGLALLPLALMRRRVAQQ